MVPCSLGNVQSGAFLAVARGKRGHPRRSRGLSPAPLGACGPPRPSAPTPLPCTGRRSARRGPREREWGLPQPGIPLPTRATTAAPRVASRFGFVPPGAHPSAVFPAWIFGGDTVCGCLCGTSGETLWLCPHLMRCWLRQDSGLGAAPPPPPPPAHTPFRGLPASGLDSWCPSRAPPQWGVICPTRAHHASQTGAFTSSVGSGTFSAFLSSGARLYSVSPSGIPSGSENTCRAMDREESTDLRTR